MRYSENKPCFTEEEREIIMNIPVLLAGCGLGSIIAECALRFGFENLSIIDEGPEEISNPIMPKSVDDTLRSKAISLRDRLQSINSEATLNCIEGSINETNLNEIIDGQKIIINTLKMREDITFSLDRVCQNRKINVLHPYRIVLALVNFFTEIFS